MTDSPAPTTDDDVPPSWREQIRAGLPQGREPKAWGITLLVLIAVCVLGTRFFATAAATNPPRLRIDPNRAPLYELMLLENIGETTALKIIAEREQNGPFRSVEDLQRVKGIGPKTIESIRDSVTIEPFSPTEPR